MLTTPLIIGIAGGTSSGKTTLSNAIAANMGSSARIISQDMYYKDLSYMPPAERASQNFDHPASIDNELFIFHLMELKKGKSVKVPEYDFANHIRTHRTSQLEPADMIIVEGILLFWESRIRDLIDIKLYLHVDSDIRFIRRLRRDIEDRHRSVHSVIEKYLSTVKPMHDQYVEASKKYADLVLSGEDLDGAIENAINMITRRFSNYYEKHEEL